MIEYRDAGNGSTNVVLTACPCGYEFESGPCVARDGTRFGSDRARHLYEDHDSRDFGGRVF